jgi:hypothetical protein
VADLARLLLALLAVALLLLVAVRVCIVAAILVPRQRRQSLPSPTGGEGSIASNPPTVETVTIPAPIAEPMPAVARITVSAPVAATIIPPLRRNNQTTVSEETCDATMGISIVTCVDVPQVEPAALPLIETRDDRRPLPRPRTRRRPAAVAACEVSQHVAAFDRARADAEDAIAEVDAFLARRAAQKVQEKVELASLPVARLRQLAVARGIRGSRLMRKSDLLTALLN